MVKIYKRVSDYFCSFFDFCTNFSQTRTNRHIMLDKSGDKWYNLYQLAEANLKKILKRQEINDDFTQRRRGKGIYNS